MRYKENIAHITYRKAEKSIDVQHILQEYHLIQGGPSHSLQFLYEK